MAAKPKGEGTKAAKPEAKAPRGKKPPGEARTITRHVLTLGVDAGNITVADVAYLLENGADLRRKARFAVLSVPPGRCTIRVSIPGAADGRVKEKLTLCTTAGRMFVGDAGFAFSKGWDAFLGRTNYLLDRNDRFRSFDTGSDGEFEVTIEVL